MTESRKQTDRLRQLQELRAFLDTQIEELTARENHRQLELCCSADKTLAGAGEPVLLCGVIHNSGCEPVEDLHLEFRLPEGLRLLPEGKNCPCCRRLPVPVLDLARLAPGETRALSVRVVADQLPAENPLQVFLDCTADGRALSRRIPEPVAHRPELQPQTGWLRYGRCPGPVEPGTAVRPERV